MLKNELEREMKKLSFISSKKMGQNFLISTKHINLILENLKIKENDKILEIGPGFGALTHELLKKNKNIFAIELDKRIFSFLKKKFLELKIFQGNILKIDLFKFCSENKINKIVSNLPYSISVKTIIKSIQCKNVNLFIFMIQKELAERLCSKPNLKTYNSLSVLLQSFFKIRVFSELKPIYFFPKPKVSSSIIELTPITSNLDFFRFSEFLKILFKSKRKMLINNVKKNYEKNFFLNILKKLNIEFNVRAENLTVKQFKQIFLEVENDF